MDKIHKDGTVDARGLVTLRPQDAVNEVQPADQRRTERATTIRYTSVDRTYVASLPVRLMLHVPHHRRGESEGSQARWRRSR